MRGLLAFISGICCLLYAYMWYQDIQVPAWATLVWCSSVFMSDLREWASYKLGVHND